MKTEASHGQGTESTSSTSATSTEEATAPGATQPVSESVETATDGTGHLPDATLPELLPAPAPTPAVRRATTRRSWATSVTRIAQSLSLDERLGRLILAAVLAVLLWFY